MSYQAYATAAYYCDMYGGGPLQNLEPTDLDKRLRLASRHIDALTFNRILHSGIDALTPYQQETLREVVCLQADFELENEDEINTILSNYSINGVSAQFGSSWNVFMDKGVAMRRDVYALLCQTGLCCALVR